MPKKQLGFTIGELRHALEEELEREATEVELQAFIDCLEIDYGQWLRYNTRIFVREKIPLKTETQKQASI